MAKIHLVAELKYTGADCQRKPSRDPTVAQVVPLRHQ